MLVAQGSVVPSAASFLSLQCAFGFMCLCLVHCGCCCPCRKLCLSSSNRPLVRSIYLIPDDTAEFSRGLLLLEEDARVLAQELRLGPRGSTPPGEPSFWGLWALLHPKSADGAGSGEWELV